MHFSGVLHPEQLPHTLTQQPPHPSSTSTSSAPRLQGCGSSRAEAAKLRHLGKAALPRLHHRRYPAERGSGQQVSVLQPRLLTTSGQSLKPEELQHCRIWADVEQRY